MSVVRKLVKSEEFHGRKLEARHMGPDLLGYVDGVELSGFFIDVEAALAGGRRFVEDEEKEAAKRAKQNERVK
jgi:hypothetical protein